MKLWDKTKQFFEGKYLVVRRDGTVPAWPYFVLSSCDVAAPAALREYAAASRLHGMDPLYADSILELADDFEKYLSSAGAGDPDAPPHRTDDPSVILAMLGEDIAIRVRRDGSPLNNRPVQPIQDEEDPFTKYGWRQDSAFAQMTVILMGLEGSFENAAAGIQTDKSLRIVRKMIDQLFLLQPYFKRSAAYWRDQVSLAEQGNIQDITSDNVTVLGSKWRAGDPAWLGLDFSRADLRLTSAIMEFICDGQNVPEDYHLLVPFLHPDEKHCGPEAEALYRVRPVGKKDKFVRIDGKWKLQRYQPVKK